MTYAESVHFLYSLGNELKVGAKWGLERMNALLAALGDPESGRRFVHVAGTNGKGSTCAMIAAVLAEAGLRTGLYTSPHLAKPTERIQINGNEISELEFAAAFEEVHHAAETLVASNSIDTHPSYFETVTAMAFLVFRDSCDISVIEVGLGGRLDATNVILPELTVITPVSFDHESFLGNTLESIASEKAGILKQGVPLIMAEQAQEVEQVVRRTAATLKVPIVSTREATLSELHVSREGCRFTIDGLPVECTLPGRHQIDNAAATVLASLTLDIERAAIQKGLANAHWPGRLEIISRRPDFVLDGAHNPAGARVLAEYIREFCTGHPVWIVYGTMRDKAIDEVTEVLFPLAKRIILTAPNVSRALRPEAIAAVTDHPDRLVIPSVSEAIDVARTAPSDAVVFFTGSLYVVGEARTILLGSKDVRSRMALT